LNHLTGPIVRADIGTIEKHIAALREVGAGSGVEESARADSNDWLATYQLLGRKTIELALKSKRIDEEQATNLKEVLRDND
jgi:hypothetical protein